jgi:hypothetical protein
MHLRRYERVPQIGVDLEDLRPVYQKEMRPIHSIKQVEISARERFIPKESTV